MANTILTFIQVSKDAKRNLINFLMQETEAVRRTAEILTIRHKMLEFYKLANDWLHCAPLTNQRR